MEGKVSEKVLQEALKAFSALGRKRLLEIFSGAFKGVLAASDAAYLQKEENISKKALLSALLPLAKTFARPVISKFYVGAIAEGESGDIYLGANLEFPFSTLNQTVHAEQAALTLLLSHEEKVKSLAITAAPCGHCRQFMAELWHTDFFIYADGEKTSLADLLPQKFGPKDLGQKGGLGYPQKNLLDLDRIKTKNPLERAALQAAASAYAPYSKSYAGVAIKTSSGKIFKGSYLENAAFNPSLGPLQAALISLNMAFYEASDIKEAVLAADKDHLVSHLQASRALFKNLCGKNLGFIATCS